MSIPNPRELHSPCLPNYLQFHSRLCVHGWRRDDFPYRPLRHKRLSLALRRASDLRLWAPPPSPAHGRSHLSRPLPHARPAANYTSRQVAARARARARGSSAMATVLSRALKLPGKESAAPRPHCGDLAWGERRGETRRSGAWLLAGRAAAPGGQEGGSWV